MRKVSYLAVLVAGIIIGAAAFIACGSQPTEPAASDEGPASSGGVSLMQRAQAQSGCSCTVDGRVALSGAGTRTLCVQETLPQGRHEFDGLVTSISYIPGANQQDGSPQAIVCRLVQ